jgi:DNA repair protein RadC
MDGHSTASGNAKQSAGHRARLRRKLLDAGPDAFHDYELL